MISVIIPVKNGKTTIKRCIDSLLNGTYKDIEIIVVDDGSDDGTYDFINNHFDDERLKIYKNASCEGPGASRNRAIKIAKGDFLAFVDADDYLPENALNIRLNTLVETECDMVLTNHVIKKDSEGIEKEFPLTKIPESCFYYDGKAFLKRCADFESGKITGLEYVWDKLFKKNIIIDNNIWFEEGKRSYEDWRFVAEYVLSGLEKGVSIVPIITYYYCDMSGVVSMSRYDFLKEDIDNFLEYIKFMLKETKKHFPEDESVKNGLNHVLVNKMIRALIMSRRYGDLDDVNNMISFALKSSDIKNAAGIYKSKNPSERMDLVNLIKDGNGIEMKKYLENMF